MKQSNRHAKFMKLSDQFLNGGKIDARRVRRMLRHLYVGEGVHYSPGMTLHYLQRSEKMARIMKEHRDAGIDLKLLNARP